MTCHCFALLLIAYGDRVKTQGFLAHHRETMKSYYSPFLYGIVPEIATCELYQRFMYPRLSKRSSYCTIPPTGFKFFRIQSLNVTQYGSRALHSRQQIERN